MAVFVFGPRIEDRLVLLRMESMSARYDCADTQQREDGLVAATSAVQEGQLVVLPTDTVYGIGADAFTPAAVTALLAAKGRGRNMPPPVLVGSVRAAAALTETLGPYGQDLIDEFWPGPLTLVFRSSPTLHWDLGDTMGTVAVRMPLHPVALDLLRRTGPMAVSSANLHSAPGRHLRRRGAAAARRLGLGLPGRRPVRRQRAVHHPRSDRDGAADAAGGGDQRRRPPQGRPRDRPAGHSGGRGRGAEPGRPQGG